MHSIEVIGPFKGFSGYDRHTREFVRQFIRQGLRVQLTDLAGWSLELPPQMREACFDQLSTPVSADTVLHFTMPTHVRPSPRKRNVNYTMFEADRIPADWAICAAASDLIVVPTEGANAFTAVICGMPPPRVATSSQPAVSITHRETETSTQTGATSAASARQPANASAVKRSHDHRPRRWRTR